MVVFVCDSCQETLSRAKAGTHRCGGALSCVDCHAVFRGSAYLAHTQCVSEKEKYEGVKAKPKSGAGLAAAIALAVSARVGTPAQQAQLRELAALPNLDALPSKKKKFINFCRSARARVFHNDQVAEALFDLLAAQAGSERSKPTSEPLEERAKRALLDTAERSATLGDLARTLGADKALVKAAVKRNADTFALTREGKKKRVSVLVA